MHSLSINCWILICCACHFQSGSPFFIYFGFLCLQVSSISNLCPDTRMKVATYLGSLVQLYCGERDTANKYCVLSCVGSALSGWTTLGLPQHKPACTSQVSTAQAPGCSVRALSQMGPAFGALPRSKLLRFLGAQQGHRPRWAVCFVPIPDPSSSVNWVLSECTVPGGLCILFTSLVLAAWFPRGATRAQSQVCHVSLLGS